MFVCCLFSVKVKMIIMVVTPQVLPRFKRVKIWKYVEECVTVSQEC